MTDADLSDANLSGAQMHGAILSGAKLTQAVPESVEGRDSIVGLPPEP